MISSIPCNVARAVISSHGPDAAGRPAAEADERSQDSQERDSKSRSQASLDEEEAMATSVKQMMEAANAAVPRITPAQAREMIAKGNALVVDVRDAPELEKSGKVAGAVHVSRGMLEFRADPESPSHDRNFAKDKNVVVYCGSGGRAALAGKLLKDMGYQHVYNLGG